jgi:hypothetical protein
LFQARSTPAPDELALCQMTEARAPTAGVPTTPNSKRRNSRWPGKAQVLALVCLFGLYYRIAYRSPIGRRSLQTVGSDGSGGRKATGVPLPPVLAAALSGAAPALHGHVAKAGALPQQHWHPRHIVPMRGSYNAWVKQTRRRGELLPFVYPQCAIFAVSIQCISLLCFASPMLPGLFLLTVRCWHGKQHFSKALPCRPSHPSAEPCLQGHFCAQSKMRHHQRATPLDSLL